MIMSSKSRKSAEIEADCIILKHPKCHVHIQAALQAKANLGVLDPSWPMKKPDTPRAMATELHLNFSGSREPIQIVQIQIGECETLKPIKIH